MTVPFPDDELLRAFAEYQIALPELGQGSFKVAYRGRSGADDIVIKILKEPLPDDDLDSDESIPIPARFGREIEGMSQVDSPYVVRLVESPRKCRLSRRDYIWYAEPFYPGGTLEDAIANSGGGEELSRKVVIALLHAVDAMWSNAAIVHRDIKPGNIVFDNDGRPVLLDLGIAYHNSLSPLTDTFDSSPRTSRYAAPEQFEMRRFAEIDFRTDLFQIGIVAFEALAGRHPFWRHNIETDEYFRNLNGFGPSNFEGLSCSDELRDVITRLLASRPSRRYRNVSIPLRRLGVMV
ncbi:serine/threonine-protein kinase [Dietzia maris]|uniref:non-specific serine/threonine protein kinase n=1 Tax=Dietzia maris TaxID=37915 RepID=A0AAE4R0N3_9ACTN|nr:serine/threonine-protein kinase [Dietzia maris]MDV6300887.1 serine/threonine-protein kinase [Dietzia maris]